MALTVTRSLIAEYLGQPVETETTTSTTPQKSGDKALIWEFKSVWSRVFGSHVDVAATDFTDRLLSGTFIVLTKTDEEREFYLKCYDLFHASVQAPLERRFWRCLAKVHEKSPSPPVFLIKSTFPTSCYTSTPIRLFDIATIDVHMIHLKDDRGLTLYTDGTRKFLRQLTPRETLLHECQHLFETLLNRNYNSFVQPDEELGEGREVMAISGRGTHRVTGEPVYCEFSDRAFAQARGDPWRISHKGYWPKDLQGLQAVIAAAHVVIATVGVCEAVVKALFQHSRHH